jgi:peptidoglycan/LPS O-acetylase OafA/YrhL
VLLLFTLASLIWSLYLVRTAPEAAFWGLPTRAWELLAGALFVCRVLASIRTRWVRECGAFVGPSLIVCEIFSYGNATVLPGESVLVPIAGAALLSQANSVSPTFVGRLLGVQAVAGVGLVSYSLFLWHWPVLVLLEHHLARGLTSNEALFAVCGSALLAVLSWLLVGRPFRRASGHGRSVFQPALSASLLMASTGLAFEAHDGIPSDLAIER